MEKNKVKNKERPQNKNLKPCKPGETHNPNGRPLGRKNYETLRREAIISYAQRNGRTPEEIERLIHEQGINQALKGEFNFYRDYMDRSHGKPADNLNVKGEISISKLLDEAEQ